MADDEATSFWTEEKHVQFLNSIEASFVTTMLENNKYCCSLRRRPSLESSESTSDLKNLHPTTGNRASGRSRITKGRRSMRRRSYQACNINSFQDQVVPQIENRQHDITDDPEQASTVE